MAADASRGNDVRGTAGLSRPFSVWAVLSLLLSMTVFCPVFSILGVLFALRALAETKAHPNMRGRIMSKTAMVISILATLGWIFGAVLWSRHARRPMLSGPVIELRAGLAGDTGAFKAGFSPEGLQASEQEAREFLQQLSHRYGTLYRVDQDLSGKGSMPLGGEGQIPYILHFSGGDVRAEALFVTFSGSLFRPVFAWDWLRINDPERGDLVYPLSAQDRVLRQTAASQP